MGTWPSIKIENFWFLVLMIPYTLLIDQANLNGWHKLSLPTYEEFSKAQEIKSKIGRYGLNSFNLTKVPQDIFQIIEKRFTEGYKVYSTFYPEGISEITNNVNQISNLVSGSGGHGDKFYNYIHKNSDFIAIHEDFFGVKLTPTMWYGPRIYHNGSLLKYHIDKAETHIISSSITIQQNIYSSWPIILEDENQYKPINVEPGYMLLYQGVLQPHFRPFLLDGSFSASIFFHYKPIF